MYYLLTGPLLWLSFGIFFIGLITHVVSYVRGLDPMLDKVAYGEHFSFGMKGAAKSIIHWIIPFGSRSWRLNPGFTILVFVFHIGLLVTPVFLLAHNLILKERFGISLLTLSDPVADIMTIAVIVTGLFLFLRRIALPEVRLITTTYDYLLLLITVMPFITGFIAYHQAYDYNFWLIAHIISGEIWLIAVPFTKLSHFILFFCTRAQIGFDYGIKRGGMKGKGMSY